MRTNTKAAEKAANKATEKAADKAAAPKLDKAAEKAALATLHAEQRATSAAIFAQLDSASVSIPVKPFSAFKRTYQAALTAHPIGRKPTPRQAAALAVAQAASGKALHDGATFPRKFEMRGAIYAIENGALRDAIASGLATYDSANETVTIASASEIKSQLGATLGTLKI